jgi:hypothetical protein
MPNVFICDVTDPDNVADLVFRCVADNICTAMGETEEAALMFGACMATLQFGFMSKQGGERFRKLGVAFYGEHNTKGSDHERATDD